MLKALCQSCALRIALLYWASQANSYFAFTPRDPQYTAVRFDSTPQVPEFAKFLRHFKSIVKRRDAEALKEFWLPGENFAGLWQELDAALSRGCARATEGTETQFVCPSTFFGFYWYKDPMPASDYLIIAEKSVPFYSEPNESAAVLFEEGTSIVRIEKKLGDWVHVYSMHNREAGYVLKKYLYSPLEYRVVFARVDGRWRVRSFRDGKKVKGEILGCEKKYGTCS